MTRTLERDQDRMYELSKADNGDIVLNVVAGGIGMYEIALTLSAEELARYNEEGKSFIDVLAYDVARNNQTTYADRTRPA
jgi:hypothetical protein